MAEPLTPTELVEALRAEQRACWRKGEPISAEACLAQHPALRAKAEWALKLVYQEVLLREARGEAPQLDEYLRRFPQFTAELKPLFVVHRALESSQPLGISLGDTPEREPRAAEAPAAPESIPGYALLDILGRGGMGIVYRARHVQLKRVVALKMILAGAHADERELARFRAEAEAQARLLHPNIVQIYEIGTADGRPYFALEYVDGGSLAQHLGGKPQPARHAVQLVETLARAVHCAHQQGVVHRDLKPANVLLTVAGTPKITDFGLAKRLQEGAGPSQSGDLLGTPSYMAPEQTTARRQAVGPPADIYALGVILYELLTGRPPFLAETPLDTLLQVRSWDPVPPRRLQPKVPRDLETICLRCLHKEPVKRYSTAEALAEDLRRFQEGKPVVARPVGLSERGLKWARRRPAVAALLLVLVLVVSASVAGLTRVWLRSEHSLASAKAINKFLVEDLLAVARPEEQGHSVTIQEALDAAAPKIETAFAGQPEVEASVRHALGLTYYKLGLYSKAEPQLKKALELYRACFGQEHPDTLEAVNSWALLLFAQDNPEEAESLLRQNLQVRRRVLGPEDLHTLYSVNSLALTLHAQGKWADAEPLFSQNLEVFRRTWGSEDPETLNAVYNLAMLFHAQGRWAEAEPLFRQNLDTRRRILPLDHPATLSTLNSLASVLGHLGKWAEGEELLGPSLETFRRVFGPDHPHTLSAVSNLAGMRKDQGKWAEAEFLYRHLLKIRSDRLSPEHSETLTTANNLAMALEAQHKWAEAEPLLRRNLEIRRASRPDHPDTLLAANNLGSVLQAQRKWDEVELLLRQNLDASRRVLGPDHPHTLTVMNNLATMLQNQGKRTEAALFFRQVLEISQSKLGPEHPNTLATVNNLARLLEDQGQWAETEALHRQNLEAKRRTLGADHPSTLTTVNNLAGVLQRLGKRNEAELLYRQNLEAQGHAIGTEHPNTLATVYHLALVLKAQGKWAEAEPLFREALYRRRKVLPEADPQIADSLGGLCSGLLEDGRATEAEPLLLEALEIRYRKLPKGHSLTADTESLLGACWTALGRYAEAEPLLLRGHEILKTTRGAPRPTVRKALDRVIKLYEAWGKLANAAAWQQERDTLRQRAKTPGISESPHLPSKGGPS